MSLNQKTIIVGGGVIGLAIGWKLAAAGQTVTLFERDAVGYGASRYAAGMLAPQTEAGFEERELLELGLESLRRYPNFLKELRKDSGQTVKLQNEGTLIVALDRDDLEALKRFFDFRVSLGLSVQWLTGSEAREREPLLSPNVIGAVFIPDDLQIEPRELLAALKVAFAKRGGILKENCEVRELLTTSDRVFGVRLSDEMAVDANQVILAAGSWSPQISEQLPIRPVKGQIITLRADATCKLSHVIRAPEAYLAPKENGRWIVGATNEEMGYDVTKTAGPIMELLQGAYEAVPAIFDCQLEEIGVGLRPGTPDNAPILGKSSIDGLIYATGHYRNGILLTPVTAEEISNLILSGNSALLEKFSLKRFDDNSQWQTASLGIGNQSSSPA